MEMDVATVKSLCVTFKSYNCPNNLLKVWLPMQFMYGKNTVHCTGQHQSGLLNSCTSPNELVTWQLVYISISSYFVAWLCLLNFKDTMVIFWDCKINGHILNCDESITLSTLSCGYLLSQHSGFSQMPFLFMCHKLFQTNFYTHNLEELKCRDNVCKVPGIAPYLVS